MYSKRSWGRVLGIKQKQAITPMDNKANNIGKSSAPISVGSPAARSELTLPRIKPHVERIDE